MPLGFGQHVQIANRRIEVVDSRIQQIQPVRRQTFDGRSFKEPAAVFDASRYAVVGLAEYHRDVVSQLGQIAVNVLEYEHDVEQRTLVLPCFHAEILHEPRERVSLSRIAVDERRSHVDEKLAH